MYYNSNVKNQPLTGYRTFENFNKTRNEKSEEVEEVETKAKKKPKKKVIKNDTIKQTEK